MSAEAEERTAPTGHVVYEAIRREGNEELVRPTSALAWSGLAAGLSMGFSFLAMGLVRAFLPVGAAWAPALAAFGMSVGFLMVILGRQQLFTENTLTVILPLMRHQVRAARNVARVWVVVRIANVVGAVLFALVLARTDVVDARVFDGLRTTALDAAAPSFLACLVRAIFAGWLIAMIVWLMPYAETGRIWVIVILTYIVGLATLAHVIVGSVEASFLVFTGDSSAAHAVTGTFVPALLGNIIGGTAIVAALNHAQVKSGQ
jgi:formate/nitrite transporter FocA (FNT family)